MASRTSRSFLAGALALAGAFVIAQPASAEPSAADKETARALMATGRQDRASGDLQGALKAFMAADALMRVPTTGLEVARSQVALGLLVEARDTALQVTRLPVAAHEPAPFKVARDAASSLSDELLSRIPSLTITVTNAPEGSTPSVTLDGAPLSFETLGTPRKLDPGHHVVTARAGSAEGKQELDVAEQDAKAVEIVLPPQMAASSDSSSDTAATPAAEPAPAGRSPASTALLIGGFGLAGVGLVAGSVTGILSLSKTSAIKTSAECSGNVCNPSEDGDISSAKSLATVSTVSFIVAGVGATAGVIGLFVGGHSSPPPAKDQEQEGKIRLEPVIGLGSLGLRGEF